MKFWQQHRGIIMMSILFMGIYAMISLVNHYQFRTYALDLGAYTNALFDYRQGHFNDSTVFKEEPENLLSDHLDFYLIVFAPLSFLFGSYTLLLLQMAALLFGGWGVYRYFDTQANGKHMALLAALYFYCFFGVYGALSFDYHSNVVAACLIPWMMCAVQRGSAWRVIFWFLVILMAKETMAMWLIFLCLGLSILHWRRPSMRWLMIGGVVVSAISFVLITSSIMPLFSNAGKFNHFRYQVLGANFGEAIRFIITNPWRVIEVFFTNHTSDVDGDGVKMELHILLMLSGIFLLLRKPAYLIMLIPIFFQKLYHDSVSLWGIGLHYNIEFAPVLAIGIFEVIGSLKDKRHARIVGFAVAFCCCFATWRMMDKTARYWEMPRVQLHKPWHYKRDYDVRQVHAILDQIPQEAKVSCQSAFVPHLALRDKVYQFPLVKDVDYIVLSRYENPYPLSQEAYNNLAADLLANDDWSVEVQEPVLLLKRK